MKVRVLIKFNDLKENIIRKIGDEFIVSESRYEEIKKAGRFVEEVEEKKETPNKKTSK